MAKLSKEDVLKLARLARLQLTEKEVAVFQAEISNVLQYVEQLQSVDLDEVDPTYQVTGLSNIMREDETAVLPPPVELLKNVPARDGNYIKVKRMII